MAEKKLKASQQYKLIMGDVAKGHIAPVYLLMGTEGYYIDNIAECLTEKLIMPEDRPFDLSVMYGLDVNASTVIDEARRFPLMSERVLVIVKEAQLMSDINALEKYVDKPVASTVLVLCYKGGVIDARKKLTARIAAKGVVFVSESPRYDRDIVEFIKEYVSRPEYNARIDERAANVMAAHVGGDLKRLSTELDKLLLAFPADAPRVITEELIERNIGISKNYNVFELRDALVKRDALKAHRIAHYYDSNPKTGGLYVVLPQLFSFFQNVMLAFYTPKPATETAVMTQLGLKNQWQVRDYVTAMRNYTPLHVLNIISKIRETDARSKGLDNANTPPGELLQELISFIVM